MEGAKTRLHVSAILRLHVSAIFFINRHEV